MIITPQRARTLCKLSAMVCCGVCSAIMSGCRSQPAEQTVPTLKANAPSDPAQATEAAKYQQKAESEFSRTQQHSQSVTK